jgi:hypothetical protein
VFSLVTIYLKFVAHPNSSNIFSLSSRSLHHPAKNHRFDDFSTKLGLSGFKPLRAYKTLQLRSLGYNFPCHHNKEKYTYQNTVRRSIFLGISGISANSLHKPPALPVRIEKVPPIL